jgi:S1/P1 Nuclease
VNVLRTFTSFTTGAFFPNSGKCVLTAIATDLDRLKRGQNDGQKLQALKFLGHWVGDVHQPLHVSFGDDRGGNDVQVNGVCECNLHSVWDSCIIERSFGTDPQTTRQQFFREITAAQRAAWQSSRPFSWANESLDIARSPMVDYCVRAGNECRYDADRLMFRQGEPEKTVLINGQYVSSQAPVVKQRLQQAGVRLAMMLNQAVGFHSSAASRETIVEESR